MFQITKPGLVEDWGSQTRRCSGREGGNPQWNSHRVTRMSSPKRGDDGKAYTSCVSRDSTILLSMI
jgi:hypothetical protein